MNEFKTRLVNIVNNFKNFECNYDCEKCPLNEYFGKDMNNYTLSFCDMFNDLADIMEVER